MLLTTIILQKTYHSQMSITCIKDTTVSKTSRHHNLFKFKFGLSLVNNSGWAVVLQRRDEGTWNISEYSIASQNDDMPEVPETKEVYIKRCLNFYTHHLYHFGPTQIVGLAFLGGGLRGLK